MKLFHGLTSSFAALAPHQLVDRHFAGENGAWSERRMWRHFRRCDDCRARYRTRSLLEALDVDGIEQAQKRLGRALFAEPRRTAVMVSLPVTFAAVLGAWALVPHHADDKVSGQVADGFQARGGPAEAVALGPAFSIVRVLGGHGPSGKTPVRAGTVLRTDEALGFTYQNPRTPPYEYLMIFAADDAGRVFWYWPAWTEVDATPTSIPISLTTAPRELAQAVRQPLARGGLTMMALFSMHPHNVREVEAALARPRPNDASLPGIEGALVTEHLEVVP